MPGEEARQSDDADRGPALLKSLAQRAEECARKSIGLPDDIGVSLNLAEALVAARWLGRDLGHGPLLLRPAADGGPAHPEASGGLPAGRPGGPRVRRCPADTRWRSMGNPRLIVLLDGREWPAAAVRGDRDVT